MLNAAFDKATMGRLSCQVVGVWCSFYSERTRLSHRLFSRCPLDSNLSCSKCMTVTALRNVHNIMSCVIKQFNSSAKRDLFLKTWKGKIYYCNANLITIPTLFLEEHTAVSQSLQRCRQQAVHFKRWGEGLTEKKKVSAKATVF